MSKLTRARLVAAVAVCLAVLAGGISYASIPDGIGVLHACYKTKTGKSVRFLDTTIAPQCKSGESQITWPTRPEFGGYNSAAVGNSALVLHTDYADVTLDCISAAEADIVLSANDGASIDIDGMDVNDATSVPVTAQGVTTSVTLAHGIQSATLLINFHNAGGSSSTGTVALSLYATKPIAAQAGKCYAQAHMTGL